MDRPLPGSAHEALEVFLGHWVGTTQWQATPWGPAREAAVELTFTRAAAGLAVTHSYRHTEADGTRSEGHGVFTMDPSRLDTLWYHVNSMGLPRRHPRAPAGRRAPSRWNGAATAARPGTPSGWTTAC